MLANALTSGGIILSLLLLILFVGLSSRRCMSRPGLRSVVVNWFDRLDSDERQAIAPLYPRDPTDCIVWTLETLADQDNPRWRVIQILLSEDDLKRVQTAYQESGEYGGYTLFQLIKIRGLWPEFHAMIWRPALFCDFVRRLYSGGDDDYPQIDGRSIASIIHRHGSPQDRLQSVDSGVDAYDTWAADAFSLIAPSWPSGESLESSRHLILRALSVRTPGVLRHNGDNAEFESVDIRSGPWDFEIDFKSGASSARRIIPSISQVGTVEIQDDVGILKTISFRVDRQPFVRPAEGPIQTLRIIAREYPGPRIESRCGSG